MISIKKFIYIFILFTISGIAISGNHSKPSIELLGIEDGKKYTSPIKLDFVVKNMKVNKSIKFISLKNKKRLWWAFF